MKAIIPVFETDSAKPIYMQLYEFIKEAILSGETAPHEKLPSLRNLSSSLNISVTTVGLAYGQLEVEGYIYSKPQSGYFVSDISKTPDFESVGKPVNSPVSEIMKSEGVEGIISEHSSANKQPPLIYDIKCFDFVSWKKCINRVLNDYPYLLLTESDPQGEELLRRQIAKYLYTSRGVRCNADQIVIAAGTQQITNHLATLLKLMDISLISFEEPGYPQVRNTFRDRGFAISPVPVKTDGIEIDRLPSNVASAAYVSPSNQFPTGAVMPVANRYRLLEWAENNDSYIIEDDYNSELRYFGRPIPSLQGLDKRGRVIYLGSFSSTLFASIKISYMVLPHSMAQMFHSIMKDYSQSCSKTEQLALAFYMESGKYQTGIKKLRRLYSRKLEAAKTSIEAHSHGRITPLGTSSGLSMLLSVETKKLPSMLEESSRSIGISSAAAHVDAGERKVAMIFYYNLIPDELMDSCIEKLCDLWLQV